MLWMKTAIQSTRRMFFRGTISLFVISAFVLAICSPNVIAQSGAGSIEGTVTDSTGAVIPEASIHVINHATGVAANTKSNGSGFYQLPGLFTGTYVVTVTAPGMETYQKTVQLLVGQNAAINFSLTAGSVSQKVEVKANAVQLVTTNSGTLSSTLERTRIEQLPMNGRIITALIGETTPGLGSHYGPGTVSNGLLKDSSVEYDVDGVPLLNLNFGGPNTTTQSQYPDPDSIQEVNMVTTDAGAMFAAPSTAVISTRSGTNSLHGSLFETMRNNAVGIARNRSNPFNFVAPPLVRNEFGASAGGPIVIPHVYDGKNKSFWFFAYERFSQISTSYEDVRVPSLAMRKGDFSELYNSANILQQLYDPDSTAPNAQCPVPGTNPVQYTNNPYCRTPFPNNQIPVGRLNPITKMLYDITPLPTNSDNPSLGSNFSAKDPLVFIVPTITFRLDHSFNPNNSAFLRYTSSDQTNIALRNYPKQSPATIAADGIPAGASGFQSINDAQVAAALGYTHIFSPTFYSETNIAQQWFYQYVGGGGADASPDTNYESQVFKLPNNFGETGFPVICGSCFMPFGGTQYQYYENQIVFNYDENLSKTVGKHQFLFGGRYRRERLSYLPSRQNDTVAFSGNATGLVDPTTGTSYGGYANTGNTEGSFFLGNAYDYGVTLEPPQGHGHNMEFDGYFQDNYHVSQNLTLNLGLRYSYLPGMWTKNSLATSFDFKNDKFVMTNPTSYYIAHDYTTQAIITNLENDGVAFETSAQAGYPSSNINNETEFQPRVGFAWTPFGDKWGTVLRGGYGKFIFPTALRYSWQNMFSGFPYVQGYSQDYSQANQSPDGLPNYMMRNKQTVFMGINDQDVVNSSTIDAIVPGFAITALDPHYPSDVARETNLTIEQPLKGNSALRVSWVWTHGSDLDQTYALNNAMSPFVWEMSTGTAVPNGKADAIGTSQYAATALHPYNNVTYGNINLYRKTCYSNDNALEVNYQRLFHHGVAYQIWYVWQKDMSGDGTVYTPEDYLSVRGTAPNTTMSLLPGATAITPGLATPPSRPAGVPSWDNWRDLTAFQTYAVNAGTPRQEVEFNGVVDLPFGTGKRFMGNADRFWNELIGGFQLAGNGSVVSQAFYPAGNWGPTHPIKAYKHGAKVKDCRSGICKEGYEWFNGYIAPTALPAPLGTCTVKCVFGLPASYVPDVTPINNTPGFPNYGNNNVQVSSPTLAESPVTIAYSPGQSNSFSKTVIQGPMNYNVDLSLLKIISITEKTRLSVKLDAFNAFNIQGNTNPNTTDGIELVQPGGVGASSHNTPRQLQLTARFTF